MLVDRWCKDSYMFYQHSGLVRHCMDALRQWSPTCDTIIISMA